MTELRPLALSDFLTYALFYEVRHQARPKPTKGISMSATITYRKTRDGEWVAYGPAAMLKPGQQVTVTKRDSSTKQEWIDSVGKPFVVDGVRMAYGYLADVVDGVLIPRSESRPAPRPASRRSAGAGQGKGGICDECQQPRRGLIECLDSSGIPGLCCPRCAALPAHLRSFA